MEKIANHIENCATCVEFLESSANDTMIDQLRNAALDRLSEKDNGGDPELSLGASYGESFEVQYQENHSAGPSMEAVLQDHAITQNARQALR